MPSSSYTDPFGGSTVQPAQVAYRAVALTADTVTVWPPFATEDNYLARIMDVTPSGASLTITLPEATLVGQGMDTLFKNLGADTFTILNASGVTVGTVAAGQASYLYLTDNTTVGGGWSVISFGVGSSNIDAAALAGYGLKAITTTLNAASVVTVDSTTPRAIAAFDRAKTYVWAGGAGIYNLPAVAVTGSDFFFEVRNQGAGALTLVPSGAELIDDSASIALQLGESCFVHCGPSAWYTVGRGRNTQFDFTQLVKNVTGGTTALTLTEAANIVQTYTGTLLSNQTIVLPAVVQIYYVFNQTAGAFALQFQSPTPGSVVQVPANSSAILFCDGINVINATTFTTTVTSFPALTVTPRFSNSSYAVGDRGVVFQYTGTFTQTTASAVTLGSGWFCDVQNVGTGVITFDPSGAETVDGRSSIKIYPGEGFRIICNGVNGFNTEGRTKVVIIENRAASGTTVDFEVGFDDTEIGIMELQWDGIASAGTNLLSRLKKSGAYITSATYYWGYQYLSPTASAFAGGSAVTTMDLMANTGWAQAHGKVQIFNPTSALATKPLLVDSASPGAGSTMRIVGGIGQSTAAAVQGFRFMLNGANTFAGGTITQRAYRN